MSNFLAFIGFKPPPSSQRLPSEEPSSSQPPRLPSSSAPPRDDSSTSSPDGGGGGGGIFAGLGDNPLFTGGLAIAALTTGFQALRKSSVRAASLLRRHMLVKVEIPSNDPSYEWFLHFLAEHQRHQALPHLASPRVAPAYTVSGILARIRPAPRELAVETHTHKTPSGATITDFVLVPGQGKHVINYNSTLIQISRQRDSRRVNLPSGTPFETLEITTLYSQRGVLHALLNESQQLALRRAEGKTIIYKSWSTEWRPTGNPQRKRPLSSVVLAPGVKESVMADLQSFLASPDWYRDRGIPYRRGYLLFGPPGTGKTSFVKAIAGDLDYNICIVNLSERGLTDDRLNHLLSNLPERSIALLEDVDAAFANRTQAAEDGYHGTNVTFSGLLNALDGAASGEDRIIILTTNHPDRLDDALLRPGRVDMKVEIGYATPEVVEGMWQRFYPDHPEELRQLIHILRDARMFEQDVKWGVSTAELQGLFLFFKDDPKGAIGAAEGVVKGVKRTT